MGSEALSNRDLWQDQAAEQGWKAEYVFYHAMMQHVASLDMLVDKKPSDLLKIYVASNGARYGIKPDFAIRTKTRTIYVEVKNQGPRGNAHERACKYWTPGILDSMRRSGGWNDSNVIPCWWVFTGRLTRTLRYQAGIRHWFKGYEGHVLLWEDTEDYDALTRHFDEHIKPLLV